MNQPVYSVVIPVFNEEAVIHETYRRLTGVMAGVGGTYELIFINDGSVDQTKRILTQLAEADKRVKLVDFSRNFGHQIAITAGMDYASGDAVIVIDADLQDPPELIADMIEKWREGYDVVYAVRKERKGETAFKRWTASFFYRVLKVIANIDIPVDTGDFRLISRPVCEVMKRLKERNRFVRGLVSWIGFKQTAITYVREERHAGQTKYPLKKMIKLSWDGITSFSHIPLLISTRIGWIVSLCSFIYGLYLIFKRLFFNSFVQGWASLMVVILFLNGVLFFILGIFGQYIARIYDETRERPLYIVKETIGFEEGER
jgi:dolichol-phosphate mannosyltransferase